MRARYVLAALLFACSSRGDPVALAEDAVRRFFSLAAAGDCEALVALSALSEDECPGFVQEVSERGVRLLAIKGAARDGRDQDAILVRVEIEDRGRAREKLVRAELRGGGIKIRL